MASSVLTLYSRVFPLPVEEAFDKVLPAPLTDVFPRSFGPIPRIKSVEGQTGVWGSVGQTRTIRLADGGSLQEELTRVDRPGAFGYTITDVTGPMRALVAKVEGLWTFIPSGAGTEITWQWTLYPKSRLVAPIMPIFCRLWRGYAARSFDDIAGYLAR